LILGLLKPYQKKAAKGRPSTRTTEDLEVSLLEFASGGLVQAPATLVDTDFSSFKENCQLLPKYCLFQQNSRTKVVDLHKTILMVLLQKFRAHA
jgi:hypothetical protein